jgi:23S rRNA pseudouridine1911/1915/1917 synthase
MTILYEDSELLVCVKPAGMLSAPKEGGQEESVLSSLAALLTERGRGEVPYPVHRLDRQTGGVMVFAKTRASAAALSAAAAGDGMRKEYVAVLEGVPTEKEGRLCDLLYFDRQKDKTYVVKRVRRGVHEARLTYTLLAVKEADETCPIPRSLVRVHLETGRTHQIRAQFAARRLPLLGDARYGANMRTPLGLFAAGLTLSHPTSGTEMTFSAPFEKLFPFSIFCKNE